MARKVYICGLTLIIKKQTSKYFFKHWEWWDDQIPSCIDKSSDRVIRLTVIFQWQKNLARIKEANFCIGRNDTLIKIYIIDFVLAKMHDDYYLTNRKQAEKVHWGNFIHLLWRQLISFTSKCWFSILFWIGK